MTTKELATRLVELCREGKFDDAQTELYAADAVSIEAHASPAFEKETTGLPAIKTKKRKMEFNGGRNA